MTWANVKDLQPKEPRKNRIIVLEDMNFIWDESELKEIRKLWKNGVSVIRMGEQFDRDPDEVLLAIMHLAKNEKIGTRRGGLRGEED